mgnify:CR=1 FL=1
MLFGQNVENRFSMLFECENNCGFCFDAIVKWFNQEHKEPIKLTQTEYHILKGLDNMWEYIKDNKLVNNSKYMNN